MCYQKWIYPLHGATLSSMGPSRVRQARSLFSEGDFTMIGSRQLAAMMLVATLGFAAGVVGGCSSGATAPLELTAEDAGSTQQLAVGQEMKVTLESNQTTGYRWAVDGEVPPQLEQVGEPTYSSESKMIGAGGQEVWTFTGAQTGSAELKLKYWRSFEPTAEPAETFVVTLNVK